MEREDYQKFEKDKLADNLITKLINYRNSHSEIPKALNDAFGKFWNERMEKKKKDNKSKPAEQKEMWFKTFIGDGDFPES